MGSDVCTPESSKEYWGGCSQKNVQKEKNLFILCQCVLPLFIILLHEPGSEQGQDEQGRWVVAA